jgi:hypothetical protein
MTTPLSNGFIGSLRILVKGRRSVTLFPETVNVVLDEVDRLRARNAELVAVLRSVEWTECQMDSALPRFCPECQERYPEHGEPTHGPYCRLDAALRDGDGTAED